MKPGMNRKANESGSAFVISILILFVLSVLGMALMLTTTTETDISVNYRWGEMAFFNADAALEYGKNILSAYALRDGTLRQALPEPRSPGEMSNKPNDGLACLDKTVPGCRDYQYVMPYGVDQSGNPINVYIGRVLRDLNNQPIQYDFRQPVAGDARGDIDNDGVMDIEGTATIWIRRPIVGDRDSTDNNRAILTAEGTAPNYDYAPNSSRPGSMRRLEMTVSTASSSTVAGDRYGDVTKASQATGEPLQEGWVTVDNIQ
jgi:hypothetical protein